MDHRESLRALTRIGYLLSAEKDTDALLHLILQETRTMLSCDSGTIYIRRRTEESDWLEFMDVQNDSVETRLEKFAMPVAPGTIPGYVAASGLTVMIPDAYAIGGEEPYSFSRAFDEKTGYRTVSIMAIPMKDRQGEVIGVISLYNKKKDAGIKLAAPGDFTEQVVPFSDEEREIAESVASQATIALENARLYQDIRRLFEGFVAASVSAVESRDPATAGHSERVADMTVELAKAVDAASSGPYKDVSFTREDMLELRYASILHDFGKVGVRERVLLKGDKLYEHEFELLKCRFKLIKEKTQRSSAEGRLACLLEKGRDEYLARLASFDRALEDELKELDDMLEFLSRVKNPDLMRLDDDGVKRLEEIAARIYMEDGAPEPYLKPFELKNLSILKGSLNDEERREIESHVTHTFQFLSKIPWTRSFSKLAEIAYNHHEKLNGKGYPRGLAAPQIPLQSRMIAIADVFDAITASDRPYKSAVPIGKALDILGFEGNGGALDSELVRIFAESKAYSVSEAKRLKATGEGKRRE